MLDSIEVVLLKRADVSPSDLFDLSSRQVDQLLERNYGKNWKVQYGLESQEESDRRQKDFKKIKYIPTKSQKEKDDAFGKKMEAKRRQEMKIKKGDKK